MNFALRHATCLHLTSSNDQHLVQGMITSFHSKCMTSGYHHDWLITSWRDGAYAYADFGLSQQIASWICDIGRHYVTLPNM